MLNQQTIYTVNDVNQQVGKTLLRNYSSIWINGEISNYKKYPSGHSYFILKDKKAQINCVLFSSQGKILMPNFKNGDNVTILGNINLYEQKGQYQYQCINIIKTGEGELWQKYLKLKADLELEGFFKQKRPMVKYPESIGIITSSSGAVLQDILTILNRRAPSINIDIYESSVQGPHAHIDLIKGVEFFNRKSKVDLILISRGGGSMEDLWSFNNYDLAMSLYNSNIPTISGIGHETDYTICDFICDFRAATPSEAAEIISANLYLLDDFLLNLKTQMYSILMDRRISVEQDISTIEAQLELCSPKSFLDLLKLKVDNLLLDINVLIDKYLATKRSVLEINSNSISILNPNNILDRGYSIIKTEKNKIVSSIAEVQIDDFVDIKFSNGNAKALIKKIKKD